ncbi:MAG: lytic transglycosylase domain-containing protein [Rhodospirillales bacterium]|nr:lytic transglycosylase domain-containing protein [Rhodospirillales bacterium]
MKIKVLCLAAACALMLLGETDSSAASDNPNSLAALMGPSVDLDARGLPAVLQEGDARLYRRIFDLQQDGRFGEADELVLQLADRRLIGHVLAQRYLHPTAYRSNFFELAAWLERYGDHPEADRIYRLALRRKPNDAEAPRQPLNVEARFGGYANRDTSFYRSPKARTPAQSNAVLRFERAVMRLVQKEKYSTAETLLTDGKGHEALDQGERDQLLARIAAARYFDGDYDEAYRLAAKAARRSGALVPASHWTAGLSAWRRQQFSQASKHFGAVAESPQASPWLAAGGAYWASRSQLRQHDPASMSRWLKKAAQYPRTFYGLIAREALGMQTTFDFAGLDLTPGEVRHLVAAPSGGRALALLQIGENARARAELLLIGDWRHGNLGEVMVALTSKADMPRFSLTLARQLSDLRGLARSGRPLLAALYPLPSWKPSGGFAVDRALLYAVMRQESAFDPSAVSHAGARGLMQIMPKTASDIADDPQLRGSRRDSLHDPGLNLRLGQGYLVHLMSLESVGDHLFRLLAAYNAGPGNLARWRSDSVAERDPLLFIESLPYGETRSYIEKVLANFWIYRKRLGQETPSLVEIANGDWPRYRQMEGGHRQAWIPAP